MNKRGIGYGSEGWTRAACTTWGTRDWPSVWNEFHITLLRSQRETNATVGGGHPTIVSTGFLWPDSVSVGNSATCGLLPPRRSPRSAAGNSTGLDLLTQTATVLLRFLLRQSPAWELN